MAFRFCSILIFCAMCLYTNYVLFEFQINKSFCFVFLNDEIDHTPIQYSWHRFEWKWNGLRNWCDERWEFGKMDIIEYSFGMYVTLCSVNWITIRNHEDNVCFIFVIQFKSKLSDSINDVNWNLSLHKLY